MKLGNIPNVIKFAFGLAMSASVALSLSSAAMAADSSVTGGVAASGDTSVAQTGNTKVEAGKVSAPQVVKTSNPVDKTTAATDPTESQAAGLSSNGESHEVGTVVAPQASTTAPATPAITKDTSVAEPVVLASHALDNSVGRAHETGASISELDVLGGFMASTHQSEAPVAGVQVQPQLSPAPRAAAIVYYHSKVLPMQPVITAVAALPADLASTTPSAADHNSDKTPTKSDGLLGQLTTVLGSVIVPSFVGLGHNLMQGGLGSVWSLIVLIVLSLNLFISTYGLWLRRSGYAHAARSDAPANLTFATPLLMSYVRVYATHGT